MVSETKNYASVTRVLDSILPLLPEKPRVEELPIAQAYGRVASRDLLSKRDEPPSSSSHMDGFAVDSRDTWEASATSPAVLAVLGESVLGVEPSGRLRRGQAYRVSTGSFLPLGADAVVPLEETSVEGDQVAVRTPAIRGSYVFEAGGDIRKGEVVIGRGRTIRAQDLGLAMTLGAETIEVFQRPVVALLATGNELTDASDGGKGMVRNSHTSVFMRLLEESGCVPLNLGISPDARREILAKVQRGLKEADMLLTMGGTSVGRRDLVGETIASLRPRAMFHGIRMDRGRVTGVAVVGQKPVLMMPGPIQGAMNAFILSGLPIIRRLSGRSDEEVVVRARLGSRWEARRRFPHFAKVLYVRLSRGEKGPSAEPMVGETESMTILARSNAYVVVPEKTTLLEAGEDVDAVLLPGFSFA